MATNNPLSANLPTISSTNPPCRSEVVNSAIVQAQNPSRAALGSPDAYLSQSPVAQVPTAHPYAPTLAVPHSAASASADISPLPEMHTHFASERVRGPENPLRNADKAQSICLDLVFPNGIEQLVVNVLREPFMRGSQFIAGALRGQRQEAATGLIFTRLEDIPASVWLKVVRVVAGEADARACKPMQDEAVAMFAAINFWLPDPGTQQGQDLEKLGDECRKTVASLLDDKDDAAMAEAIVREIEGSLYKKESYSQIPNYRTQRLKAFRKRLAVSANEEPIIGSPPENGDATRTAGKPHQIESSRSYVRANVSMTIGDQSLQFAGCGYTMASASKAWSKALPNITLSANVPPEVWDKILCVVHRVGDSALCGPRAGDAAFMVQAIESIEPDDSSSTGCALLSLAQQCETLQSAKITVDKLRNAIEYSQKAAITSALQAISQGDRMVVAYLDSALLRMVSASDPWLEEKASIYELLIDWAQYHGPQAKDMASFMRDQGLEDAADWRHCSSALREEAIATGILPKAADLAPNSLRYVKTVDTSQDYLDVEFIDANELFTFDGNTVARWDAQTGKKIASFPLSTNMPGFRRDSEFPTHGRILGHRLFGSEDGDFRRDHPTLWNIDTGKKVTRLHATPDCKPPKTRAQGYRFIVSGSEGGAELQQLRVGVWGKRGFGAKYEFLQNFQPDGYRCDQIVGHQKSLFTAIELYTSKYAIEERDLKKNTLVRTWTLDNGNLYDRIQLFVTLDYVVCLVNLFPGEKEVIVYRRDATSHAPALRFDPGGVDRGAVSGHYLAGVGHDHFTIWDLHTGQKVQTILNEHAGNSPYSWRSIGFDGTTVVVSDKSGRLHFYKSHL